VKSHFSKPSCGFLIVAALVCLPAASSAEPGRPSVLVMLQNLAGAPSALVELAQGEVARLYALIGVEVVWVTEVPDHAGHMRVVCLTTMRPPRGVNVADSALGYTLLPRGKRAILTYVMWRRVESASGKFTTAIDKVLAMAIAHELGHMLLPDARHAKSGLMRAIWDGNAFRSAGAGLLVFSPDSADLIRREVEREWFALEADRFPR
jgi:hypothetical protein